MTLAARLSEILPNRNALLGTAPGHPGVRARKSTLIASRPGEMAHVIAALEACDRLDLFQANEHFYRWLSGEAAHRRLAARVSVLTEEFMVVAWPFAGLTSKLALLRKLVEKAAFPGAAMALARWTAKSGDHQAALTTAQAALAAARASGHRFDFHLLENQITALDRRIAGRPIHRALERYLGDDDGYMRERTCQYPFERMDIQENGNCAVCCAHWMPGFSLGNVMRDGATAQEIYNGSQAEAVRRSMLDGSFRFCDAVKCPVIAADRLPSKANGLGPNRQVPLSDHLDRALHDGAIRFEHPAYLFLAFDQSCNLTCPSCRKGLITEKIEIQAHKEKLIETSIIPFLREARVLNINSAGEIFVSRPLRRLLSRLNRRDFPNLRIEMISNGTLFTPEEWNKFPGIHEMVDHVRISTDGATKATFEKLRRGARWEPFLENLRFISTLLRAGAIERFLMSMTYQVDNFREMPAFVSLCRELGAITIFEKLENWGTFSEEEYHAKAVHRPSHPAHEEFLAIARQFPLDDFIWPDYMGLVEQPGSAPGRLRDRAA